MAVSYFSMFSTFLSNASLEKAQIRALYKHTVTQIPESCSNTDHTENAHNDSYLLTDSQGVTTTGLAASTGTQKAAELCIQFHKEYIIIHVQISH